MTIYETNLCIQAAEHIRVFFSYKLVWEQGVDNIAVCRSLCCSPNQAALVHRLMLLHVVPAQNYTFRSPARAHTLEAAFRHLSINQQHRFLAFC